MGWLFGAGAVGAEARRSGPAAGRPGAGRAVRHRVLAARNKIDDGRMMNGEWFLVSIKAEPCKNAFRSVSSLQTTQHSYSDGYPTIQLASEGIGFLGHFTKN